MSRDFLASDARIQDKWESFWDRRQITLQGSKLFTAEDRVFTVGSCFAYEIKKAMIGHGVKCLPDYADMQPDRSRVRLENDEGVPLFHLQHYNTYTVLGEFERIAGLWTQDPDDYWTVTRGSPWRGETAYQDPYRRRLYGRTVDDLHAINAELDEIYRAGFAEATSFFFTFGMTEVFRQKSNGRVVCQRPLYAGGGGLDETEFYMSSYADNLANIEKLIGIIRGAKPDAKIVMTVSPVPLARSFSGRDVTIATTESKSILRAVLGEVSRRHDVLYFPSYEAITWQGIDQVFGGYDNRHVHDEKVHNIMKTFIETYFELPQQPGRTEPDDQGRSAEADVSGPSMEPGDNSKTSGLAETPGSPLYDSGKIYQPTHRTGEWGRPFATDNAQLARFVAENPVRRNALAAFVNEFAATLPEGSRVLDAGAGSMPYSALLAHTQYMTLDWPNSVHGRQPDIVGDLSKPVPAPDESFDAVLCTEVLEHIFDLPSAIAEVHRLLKPGARLAGTTPFLIQLHEQPYDYWRPTAYALEKSLAQAGFTDIQVQPLTGYFGSLAVMLRWMPLMTGVTSAITSIPQWQEIHGMASKAAEWLVEHAHQLDDMFDPAKLMPAGYAFTATKGEGLRVLAGSAGAGGTATPPVQQVAPSEHGELDQARTRLMQEGIAATPPLLALLAQVPDIEVNEAAQAVLADVVAVLLDECERGELAGVISVFEDSPAALAEMALSLLTAAFFPDGKIVPAEFDDSAALCFSLFVAVAGRPLAALDLIDLMVKERNSEQFAANATVLRAHVEKVISLAPPPTNVVVTCYFNSIVDAQRGHRWPSETDGINTLGKSVQTFGLPLVVLHDCFAPETMDAAEFRVHEWSKVTPADSSSSWNRWYALRDYLNHHKEITALWMVDSTDTELFRQPFGFMEPATLYVGHEPWHVEDATPWALGVNRAQDIHDWVLANPELPMLNCGVVGGDRTAMMTLAQEMISFREKYPDNGGSDNMGFNMLMRTAFPLPIRGGRAITTNFKHFEKPENCPSVWRHK